MVRSIAEAVDSLASPYAVDEHSALAGAGAFVVDLDTSGGDPNPARLAVARAHRLALTHGCAPACGRTASNGSTMRNTVRPGSLSQSSSATAVTQ